MDSRVSTLLIFSWSMASNEYILRGPRNTFDAEIGSTKPHRQTKQILKSGFILLNAPQGSENSRRAPIIRPDLSKSLGSFASDTRRFRSLVIERGALVVCSLLHVKTSKA